MTTMAERLMREQVAIDKRNARAVYHTDPGLTDHDRTRYAEQYAREIQALHRKYGVQRREVRTLPNGLKEYELVCSDGSVVGTIHDA